MYFYIFLLLSIIDKGVINNARTYCIDYIISRIEGSLLIDNINDRFSKVILLEINELFIVLSNCNIDSKIVIKVFITSVINVNNELMVEFSIIGYNCVLK